MLGQLTPHLGHAQVDDRLRTARERRVSRVTPAPPSPAGNPDAHERQRRLVSASLLLSGRSDRSTSRRWA